MLQRLDMNFRREPTPRPPSSASPAGFISAMPDLAQSQTTSLLRYSALTAGFRAMVAEPIDEKEPAPPAYTPT